MTINNRGPLVDWFAQYTTAGLVGGLLVWVLQWALGTKTRSDAKSWEELAAAIRELKQSQDELSYMILGSTQNGFDQWLALMISTGAKRDDIKRCQQAVQVAEQINQRWKQMAKLLRFNMPHDSWVAEADSDTKTPLSPPAHGHAG